MGGHVTCASADACEGEGENRQATGRISRVLLSRRFSLLDRKRWEISVSLNCVTVRRGVSMKRLPLDALFPLDFPSRASVYFESFLF